MPPAVPLVPLFPLSPCSPCPLVPLCSPCRSAHLVVHGSTHTHTENILLDENKNIKIIDFGLSNLYDNEKLLETFCGSPKYAAPEIITGVKYLGPSVDIWSIGVILFASLCGKLPFNGSTIEKTYARVLQGVINYPPHLTPGTPMPSPPHQPKRSVLTAPYALRPRAAPRGRTCVQRPRISSGASCRWT